VLAATGRLTYVNRSPDTLRELFLHQHLNAFRPGSRWAETDAREGRVRFQTLAEPAFAFERFTRPPVIDGTPVVAEYPGGPDSTVVRLALPRALAPGDSVAVELAWEARPSTIPRRQARRGRSYDSGTPRSPCTTGAGGSRTRSCPRASSTASSATST
jgi:hypothetical protein